MNEIIVSDKKKHHPIPEMFSHLGIEAVSSADRFSLTYRDGILEAHVKRQSGKTEATIKHVKGGFDQMTTFDPTQMTRDDRNDLIKQRYAKGETQKQLEKTFGLTQAMISKIVNS